MLRRLSKERVPATGELLFDNLKVCNSRTVSPASGEMLAGASAPARDAVLMRVRGKNGSFVRRFRPACSRSFATARKAGACRLVWKWLQKGTLRDLPIAASLKCRHAHLRAETAAAPPRSPDRGLVEVLPVGRRALAAGSPPRSPDRGLVEVSKLASHGGLAGQPLRDLPIAASLKLDRRLLGCRFATALRDLPIAASLKSVRS